MPIRVEGFMKTNLKQTRCERCPALAKKPIAVGSEDARRRPAEGSSANGYALGGRFLFFQMEEAKH